MATGVQFDVFELVRGDSVRTGPLLMMSTDIGDGNRLPVTSAASYLTGDMQYKHLYVKYEPLYLTRYDTWPYMCNGYLG